MRGTLDEVLDGVFATLGGWLIAFAIGLGHPACLTFAVGVAMVVYVVRPK